VPIVSESMQEMMEREKAEAVAMMKRANSAMSRIFGIDDSSVGTCDKCNSWDDILEAGVCQTCIKEDEGDE